jgi:hypothetical protein
MLILNFVKSVLYSFTYLKFIVFGALILALSLIINLYYYSIPEQVAIEIIGLNDQVFSEVDVHAASFLAKQKKFDFQTDNKWISRAGLIRNISIKIPESSYADLSHISISIGDTAFKIEKKQFAETIIENSNKYRKIKIEPSLIQKFGLINYKFSLKQYLRSLFDALCFGLFAYSILLIIRALSRKKHSKEFINKVTPYSIIPVNHLVFFSILLMIIPWLVFIGGYLKIQFSIIIIAILLFTLFKLLKDIYVTNIENCTYKVMHIIIVAIITLIFIFLSGIGGLGLQNNDWVKHNYILSDLINHTWPVIYDYNFYENSDIGGSALIYYTGYYMLPAIFGKLFGWPLANIVLIIQSCVALFLIFCWIIYFVGNKKNAIYVVLLFLIFSGADIIGHLFNFDTFLYFSSDLYTESLNIQYCLSTTGKLKK